MLHLFNHVTMVLASKDNHQTAVSIPAGKIVDVVGPAPDDRFVIVNLDGEHLVAFASDIADHAAPIKAVGRG
jgi:hypothetical protein